MPRTLFAVALVLLALLPGRLLAGPPEGVAGEMVLDKVADGLRRYRKETDPNRQSARLWRLAPTRDPRVAVACMDALSAGGPTECMAYDALLRFYVPDGVEQDALKRGGEAIARWRLANEANLRRRAKELP